MTRAEKEYYSMLNDMGFAESVSCTDKENEEYAHHSVNTPDNVYEYDSYDNAGKYYTLSEPKLSLEQMRTILLYKSLHVQNVIKG